MLNKKLTQSRLKEVLRYYPDTGIFIWKVSSRRRRSGSEAGSLRHDGRVLIATDNQRFLRSRLAWLYMEGYFPENDVDHENRIRNDDRWSNLRHVSRQCNNRNVGLQKNNISGVCGVYFHKRTKKWCSKIAVNGKLFHIGYSMDFNEAVLYRLAAEQCLDWAGCNSSSSAYKYAKKNGLIKKEGEHDRQRQVNNLEGKH